MKKKCFLCKKNNSFICHNGESLCELCYKKYFPNIIENQILEIKQWLAAARAWNSNLNIAKKFGRFDDIKELANKKLNDYLNLRLKKFNLTEEKLYNTKAIIIKDLLMNNKNCYYG